MAILGLCSPGIFCAFTRHQIGIFGHSIALAGQPAETAASAVVTAALSQVRQQLDARNAEIAALRTQMGTTTADLETKQTEINDLKEKVRILSDMREPDAGAAAGRASVTGHRFDLNDEKQLGGREGVMFALDRPYNQRARASLMVSAGYKVYASAESAIDYSTLREDLGAFYRQPWQDRLQSILTLLPTVEEIFPLQSGYQDLATLVNIWLGEFSQSDNSIQSDFDNVAKGSYDFSHETLRMYSVMFAHKFRDLKQLEQLWIGSLNKEGSDPIKWSFIEFILAETAKKLHNEREQRRINGVRRNPCKFTPSYTGNNDSNVNEMTFVQTMKGDDIGIYEGTIPSEEYVGTVEAATLPYISDGQYLAAEGSVVVNAISGGTHGALVTIVGRDGSQCSVAATGEGSNLILKDGSTVSMGSATAQVTLRAFAKGSGDLVWIEVDRHS